jgi:hypothetical protein
MARLKEIVSDTVGITAAIEGAKTSEGVFRKIYRAYGMGVIQVMEPNFYYDVTASEDSALPQSDKPIRRFLADATFATGIVLLATVGGQPEIAVAAKVVYNAGSAWLNRDRTSKLSTSQA